MATTRTEDGHKDCQNKHYNIDQKDEGTRNDQGRGGGTNFILRIKEQDNTPNPSGTWWWWWWWWTIKYSLHNSRIHRASIHFSARRCYFCSVWFTLISEQVRPQSCPCMCQRYHFGYSHSVGPLTTRAVRFLSSSLCNLQHISHSSSVSREDSSRIQSVAVVCFKVSQKRLANSWAQRGSAR